MTTDQRFTLTISAIGLVFLLISAGLGLIVRITIRWTKIEDALSAIAEKIQGISDTNHKDLTALDIKIEKVDDRLDRHERWHDEHPYIKDHQ